MTLQEMLQTGYAAGIIKNPWAKLQFTYHSEEGGLVGTAFKGLATRENRLALCLELIRVWITPERLPEAEKLLGKDSSYLTKHGTLWGMTLADTQLRVWVDCPSSIRTDYVDSCGGFIYLNLSGDQDTLKWFFLEIEKVIFSDAKWLRRNLGALVVTDKTKEPTYLGGWYYFKD